MRIISLVPSLTEYLWSLGLDEEVVGITKFCIHPEHWRQKKTRVGGTKKLNFEKIAQLQPTLIITNKEENTKEEIELLMANYEVLLTDIQSLDDAYFYLLEIGKRVEKLATAKALVHEIKSGFHGVGAYGNKATYLYFIWKDPYFVVGTNTYIHALLQSVGLVNFCKLERYPELKDVLIDKEHVSLDPDLIFLSSEPFPFEEKHLNEFKLLFPRSTVLLVDGEICSWYGSRMLKVPHYMKRILGSVDIS